MCCGQDYIRTARAKGLSARRSSFAPRAAATRILPIVAMIGIDIGHVHERRRGGGERVRLAGHRPARLAGDPAGRHPDHHGRDAGLGAAPSCSATCWPTWSRRSIDPRIKRCDDASDNLRKGEQDDAKNWLMTHCRGGAGRGAARLLAPGRTDDAKQGGTIIVTYKDDIATLDPAIGYDWQNWSMIKSLFDAADGLQARHDRRSMPDAGRELRRSRRRARPTPSSSARASKFHNGREVIADDVKYSIERAVNPKTQGPGAGFFTRSRARRRHRRQGRPSSRASRPSTRRRSSSPCRSPTRPSCT